MEDGADASEKKAPKKGRWNKNKKNKSSGYANDDGEEKFEGACDEMKGKVFSIGRNQADNFAHSHKMLQIVVGVKYTSKVAAAIRDYKVKPTNLRAPIRPELAALISDGTLLDTATAVPENFMDVYREKVKIYSKIELQFEQHCESAFSLVIGQCSPNMISELKCHDEYDAINDEYQLVKLLLLIKKICFNYKT